MMFLSDLIMTKETGAIWESIKPVAGHGLTVIITALTTYVFTACHFRKQKRHEFLQRRLDELYGPLLGLIKQVRANANSRVAVSRASDKAWRKICDRNPKPFLDHDDYFKPFERQISYENERFRSNDLPAYDTMLHLLKSKNHLAYTSTLEWFNQLAQYVDHLHRPLAGEVLRELGISEEPLFSFYEDVEWRCNQLKRKLSGVSPVFSGCAGRIRDRYRRLRKLRSKGKEDCSV